ncbi:MAG: hypothetical protein P0S96_02710 [Simkaniaceae bacterium]|nr:hypothetical protein [Candidatus Sacchlamyda saccharinae]
MASPSYLCDRLYVQARGFQYPDDDQFAKIASTFLSKTAYNTAAVALAALQTACYAFLSIATLPLSPFGSKQHEKFAADMQVTSRVLTDIFDSALWGEKPSTQKKTEPKEKGTRRYTKEILLGGAIAAITLAALAAYHFSIAKAIPAISNTSAALTPSAPPSPKAIPIKVSSLDKNIFYRTGPSVLELTFGRIVARIVPMSFPMVPNFGGL